jgi:protocatechuate 3,4-dioxygenase beta subunit
MRAGDAKRGRALVLAAVVAVGIGIPSVGTLDSPRAAADTPSQPSSCPTSNPPNGLTLAGGTPQTAQLNTGFGSPLQVTLANSNGCPVTSIVGTPVTFTAPASGASGRFATSGTNTVTVGADQSGNASAPTFTANETAGSYTVIANSAYGSVSFSLTNSAAGIPATITPLPPATQSAGVNSGYTQPLSVRVLDTSGAPVPGATVTFALAAAGADAGSAGVSSAGASFAGGSAQASATTDSDGIATSPRFAANATIGRFTATATVANLPAPAQFQLENLPGKGVRLTRLDTATRAATVEHRYSQSLRVLVRDAQGDPEIGASVTFTLGGAGGSAGAGGGSEGGAGAGASFAGGTSTATAITGIHGIATSPAFTAGSVAGTFTATATATTTTSTVHFTLRNRAGSPATITPGIAASEATQAGTRFSIALAVTVTDTFGNKVPGALVTFTAPASGASGSFATSTHPHDIAVRTDSRGIAVAPPLVANTQPGGYVVIASVAHGPRTAFALVNETP